MKLRLTWPAAEREKFLAAFFASLEEMRIPIQDAMAKEFLAITQLNIGGISGWSRPVKWKKLSPDYALRVKRSYATLFVSGLLLNSIKPELGNKEFAAVGISDAVCPYATAHQFGSAKNNLPARPYFPFTGGYDEEWELTPTAERLVTAAASNAAQSFMKGVMG